MSAPTHTRPMGPRRALPTPPTRQAPPNHAVSLTSNWDYHEEHPDTSIDPSPEMMAALGPPPSAIAPRSYPSQAASAIPASLQPGSYLNPAGGPSATPIPSPMPSPNLVPFQPPPPPPPIPGRSSGFGPQSGRASPRPTASSDDSAFGSGDPTPSEIMRAGRNALYSGNGSGRPQLSLRGTSPAPAPGAQRSDSTGPGRATAPLNVRRPKPRVEVPSTLIPSDLDSADADDERIVRMTRPRAQHQTSYERSNLAPSLPSEATPSPGPMLGRIGGGASGRPNLGLRTASTSSVGSALPDEDAPAPPPIDPNAGLSHLRPKLQLPSLSMGGDAAPRARPKLGLALPGSQSQQDVRPGAPSLKLDLSSMQGNDSEDDVDYSYYGKNPSSNRSNSLGVGAGGSESFPSDSSAATLRPPSTTTATPGNVATVHTGRAGDGLDDVRRAINELRMPSSQTYDESEEIESGMGTGTEDNPAPHSQANPQRTPSAGSAPHSEDEEWNDDMLEIVARLGEGAGGAVSKVRDKRTGRLMARKTIPTGTVPARQLLRELQFSQLIHPNLIVCYGAYISSSGDSNGNGQGNNLENPNGPSAYTSEIHILMELGEGGALDSIARQMKARHANVRIGEKVIARLAEGVLKGLDYMHQNKVIHRDIKPSNILVTKAGVVKLCDFGVSGVLEASLAETFTGTSWYMAPERITGHKYSIRADVWSTGLTFLELAQNRFPYPPDLGPIELLTYIVNGEVPELDDEPGDENGIGAIVWSDGMKSFIKQCLRIDAATRPPPRDMLNHPWIQESMARKLDMSKWIREVWGWEKPPRSKRASQVQDSSVTPAQG